MSRLTLKNLRDSRAPQVLNVCPDDPRIAQWASAFQERALALGRWWGSVQTVQFCISSGCLVLPREVAVIEAANINGCHARVRNSWFQFVSPHSPCDTWFVSGRRGSCNCCGCAPVEVEDRDTAASFAVTLGSNKKLRSYLGGISDVGKKIIYQGYDKNGVWVRTLIDGVVSDGEQVVLASPFIDTQTIWAPGAPMAVIKDQTDWRVLLYSVDQDNGLEAPLGEYQPSELNPQYRVVKLANFNQGSCNSGCNPSTLLCIVSLAHIPIQYDSDFLMFSNLQSYVMGCQSEKFYEENNITMGDAYFFGVNRAPRNLKGVLRHTFGMGALPILNAELRKMTGDRISVAIQQDGVNLLGFR